MKKQLFIIVVSTILAAMRVLGVKHEAFQAVAHLWVGGLFGSYFVNKDSFTLYTAVVISLIELGVFLVDANIF
jgi:hypothetical protein